MTASAAPTVRNFPELGFYTLPGHTRSPRDLIDEVTQAEALGMGSAWISERFDVKEAAALAGAAGAVTNKLFIGTAATNINSRHPLVTASIATTLVMLGCRPCFDTLAVVWEPGRSTLCFGWLSIGRSAGDAGRADNGSSR